MIIKEKTAICENCEEEVTYKTIMVKKTYTIRGISFDVEIYRGLCDQCGHEVYPAEFDKKNDIIIYDEYKRRAGLLTSEEIIKIRKKRRMSQTDLARFIQCGEKNIARYERGAIQDPVFDYLIRLVANDKAYEQMKTINLEIANTQHSLLLKNS